MYLVIVLVKFVGSQAVEVAVLLTVLDAGCVKGSAMIAAKIKPPAINAVEIVMINFSHR